MTGYIIYGDRVSGNCLKVKWTADYLGADYEWRDLSVVDGETRTESFLEINPAGQVPAVVLPSGQTLAQSNAIILYLNQVFDGDLLPDDDYLRGKVFEWLFWEQYSHEPAIAVRRFQKAYLKKPDDEIDPALLTKGHAALSHLERLLSENRYIVGGALSLADIALLAYTRTAPEGGFSLDPYPSIRAWIARAERDLSIPSAEAA